MEGDGADAEGGGRRRANKGPAPAAVRRPPFGAPRECAIKQPRSGGAGGATALANLRGIYSIAFRRGLRTRAAAGLRARPCHRGAISPGPSLGPRWRQALSASARAGRAGGGARSVPALLRPRSPSASASARAFGTGRVWDRVGGGLGLVGGRGAAASWPLARRRDPRDADRQDAFLRSRVLDRVIETWDDVSRNIAGIYYVGAPVETAFPIAETP